MKTFRSSKDGGVVKFIHDDQSETCIKTVHSVDVEPDESGELKAKATDRKKYSIFASTSSGCPKKCTFCYLTIDKVPYQKSTYIRLFDNVARSIQYEAKHSDLRDRYVKMCWMGMGDAGLAPMLTCDVTEDILDWVMNNGYAKGLDGVDISTVLPIAAQYPVDHWINLNNSLEQYPLNPNNKSVVNKEQGTLVEYRDRSRLRVFYSLHSAIQKTRDIIIPNTPHIVACIPYLQKLQEGGVNVIIHHMFLDGINDTEEEVEALIYFMKRYLPDSELRVLRYNKHQNSPIKESDVFQQCVCMLYQADLKKVKVQVSYGLEVKSACGQFIYNNTSDVEQFKQE